jgi:predicted MFS family arabinose efflux permease
MARRRGSRSVAAARAVFANPQLRRVELADSLFVVAKWGTRVSIFVFAFQRGGAAETGVVAVIALITSAVVAPVASVLGDRMPRERALLIGYAVQTLSVGGTAVALFAGTSAFVVYALLAVVTASMTLTRPAQSALFPQLALSPDELIGANAIAGSIHGGGALIGPAVGGVLVEQGGADVAYAIFAGLLLGATLLVVRLAPHPPSAHMRGHPLRGAFAGFRSVAREPDQRLVVGLLVGRSVVAGVLDVLVIVIALGLFGLESSAAGYLWAARGAGGILGGIWGLRLVGHARVAAALAVGLLVFGFGTAGIAFATVALLGGAILVVAETGYGRADMAGRTLLQRVVPDHVLTRVFGVLEGVNQAGSAAGAAIAPILVATLGIRGGTIVAGLLLPVGILLLRGRIRALDREIEIPEREIALLGSVDLFASLQAHAVEGLADRMKRIEVRPGTVLVREGDTGDRFYVVEEGDVEVTVDGRPVATLGTGDYFGEIALLRDVPRTATVTATTPTSLLELERADFLEELVGHPVIRKAVEPTIEERMLEDEAGSSPPGGSEPPDRG